jgi:UDP-glucose 4-epimerase
VTVPAYFTLPPDTSIPARPPANSPNVKAGDVVDALVAAATASDVNRAVINIGSGQEVSINALAVRVGQVTGKRINILHNRMQLGGVSRLVADVSLARQLLGWSPCTDLDEGLRLTLENDPRFRDRKT